MELYPNGPASVPADLTKPTSKFKLHAWLAVLALLAFVTLYFWLTGWFGWTAFRFVRDGLLTGHLFIGALKALPAAFVFAFLVRGIFAVKHNQDKASIEIEPKDEPELFAFLYRLADEAGAPRPHRVFLSPDVNAGVFYDLSVLNLILPSKKNVVIGLGVLGSLDLSELKAVLAHEFGHFAQRSMAIGSWVYIAEQVAGNIIAVRGRLDRFLDAISYTDIRIAWIGWLMKIFIWSVRAVLDTMFLVVVLAKRALSREMELQADLVAVSLTGSDALVHTLHKLPAANDAFGRAVGFAQAEVQKGKVVEDLYAVQEHMLTSIRRITSDDTWGVAPPLPESAREQHRVFPDRFAQPPKMWSTHPPSREREDNAKRVYVPCELDARPAWSLFGDPAARRKQMTRHFLSVLNEKQGLPSETLPTERALENVDESFGRTYLETRYRGLYLARGVTRNAATVEDLYEPSGDAAPSSSAMPTFDELYPEELVQELEKWKDLEEEHATLKALKDGFLKAPGGVVRYRGGEVSKRDLSRVIDDVDRERKEALARVVARDQRCRTAHRLAARRIGGGWEDYLLSLAALLHYAEHTEADIRDADGHFANVFAVVIADGRVSSAERRRLVRAAGEAYDALERPFREKLLVHLPDAVKKRMELTDWAQRLGELTLNPPSEANIGDWLRVADSWLLSVPNDFASLRAHVLEVLLDAEEHVARCARGECEAGEAPEPAEVPERYPVVLPGKERERQTRLDFWDRFQLAEGLFPATARLAVALAVLSVGFFLGGVAASRSLAVFNGLETRVDLEIGDEHVSLRPHGAMELELDDEDTVHIVARTELTGELIEELDADLSVSQAQYVYNVAGASPLVEWRAEYSTYNFGSQYEPQITPVGASRISTTAATVLFREPPSSVSTSSGSTSLLVLDAPPTADPAQVLALVTDPAERAQIVAAHARFDDPTSPHFARWILEATQIEGARDVVASRLAGSADTTLLRLEQDLATDPTAHEAVCARHRALAERAPSADHDYLVTRCIADPAERARAFVAGYDAQPQNPWFARAAGAVFAASGDFERALSALETAKSLNPSLTSEVAVDIARVRRAMADDPSYVDLELLATGSPMLAQLVGIEQGADWAMSGVGQAWVMLARGQLDQALMVADTGADPAIGDYVARLAAASDYAPDAIVARALALPAERGVAPVTIWSAIALARREGRDTAPLVARATELFGAATTAQMLDWSDPDKLRAPHDEMEAALASLDITLRGQARVMGILTLREEAPPEWRREARALLFSSERPYLVAANAPVSASATPL